MDIKHDCNSVLGRMMLAEVRNRQDDRSREFRNNPRGRPVIDRYPLSAAAFRHQRRLRATGRRGRVE